MPQLLSEEPPDERETETTVLFVDDEPGLLDVYEIQYGSEFDVRTATDGAEAIEAFGDHVDFAFFDRRMPGMSGDEAIRALRDRGYQTPFGIISAVDPDPESTVECDVYLRKPVDEDRVRDAIDQYTF